MRKNKTNRRPTHILCVCHANLHRSPTAQRVLIELLKSWGGRVYDPFAPARDHGFEVVSAGVHADDECNQMDIAMGRRADVIFAMDASVADKLISLYGVPRAKLIALNIPDTFRENDPRLVKQLTLILARFRRRLTKRLTRSRRRQISTAASLGGRPIPRPPS